MDIVGKFSLLLTISVLVFCANIAANTRIAHDRLILELPGTWQVKKNGQGLFATLGEGAVLTVAPAVKASDNLTLKNFLDQVIANTEKRVKAKLLKIAIDFRIAFSTKSTTPVAMVTRLIEQPGGKFYYGYYVATLGDHYQLLILIAGKEFSEAYSRVNKAVDNMQTNLPRKNVAKIEGQSIAYFNYKLKIPAHWKKEDGRMYSTWKFKVNAWDEYGYRKHEYKNQWTSIDPSPEVPTSPVPCLKQYLCKQADVGIKHYDARGFEVVWTQSGRLANGLQFVSMLVKCGTTSTRDDNFWYLLGGVMVIGEDSAVLMGTGMYWENYNLTYYHKRCREDQKLFSKSIDKLMSIATSIEFDTAGFKENKQHVKWLIKKGKFYYHRQNSQVSGDLSFFSEKTVQWKFYSDQTADFSIQGFTTASTFDSTGGNREMSDYATRKGQGAGRFNVVSRGDKHFLLMFYPSGVGSVHKLVIKPKFEIDFYRNQ